MTTTSLRARVVLEEARALGLSLADLVAAADELVRVPTLADFVAEIEPTFTPGTAATYRPYWRLAVALLGNRCVSELSVADLNTVVDAAVVRARRNRPGSTGRASAESCVAALRAIGQRAVGAGLLRTNLAAALTKPRRARSQRRALEEVEVVELIDAVRPPASTLASTCCLCGSTSRRAPDAPAPSPCARSTWIDAGRRSG